MYTVVSGTQTLDWVQGSGAETRYSASSGWAKLMPPAFLLQGMIVYIWDVLTAWKLRVTQFSLKRRPSSFSLGQLGIIVGWGAKQNQS